MICNKKNGDTYVLSASQESIANRLIWNVSADYGLLKRYSNKVKKCSNLKETALIPNSWLNILSIFKFYRVKKANDIFFRRIQLKAKTKTETKQPPIFFQYFYLIKINGKSFIHRILSFSFCLNMCLFKWVMDIIKIN